MKRFITFLLTMCFAIIPAAAFSEDITNEKVTAVLYLGSPYITVNGVVSALDLAPFISEGNVMIPVRSVIEAMGGSVDWHESSYGYVGGKKQVNQMVIIRMGWRDAFFSIGSKVIFRTLRDDNITMGAAPTIVDGRTVAPVRPIMEALDYSVEWNADDQSITITYLPFEDAVVGTVNGEPIYLSDFNLMFNNVSFPYRMHFSYNLNIDKGWRGQSYDGIENIGEYVRDKAIKETQRYLIAVQKAEEYGIDTDSEEIWAEVQRSKEIFINNTSPYDPDDDYQRYLYTGHITDSAVDRGYLQMITALRLSAALADEGGPCYVPEDEVGYTDENYIKIKLLDMPVFDESSAEAAAEVQRRLDAGESFETLYDEYNSSDKQYTVITNTDTEPEDNFSEIVVEQTIVPKIVTATAKDLEMSQLSVVEYKGYITQGYFFILRLPLSHEDDAFHYLRQNMEREKLNYVLDEWLAESEVTVDYEAIDIALDRQE